MTLKVLYTILLFLLLCTHVSAVELEEIREFLATDQTDEGEYLQYHSCGHFARELSRNASLENISIGAVTVGSHPVFRGLDNHAVNYFEVDGTIYFIEPQNDMILTAADLYFDGYLYARFWADGTQMPTNWRGNRAHNYKFAEHLDEELPRKVISGSEQLSIIVEYLINLIK